MKTRLLVTWLIARGSIAAAEVRTAICEQAHGLVATVHK